MVDLISHKSSIGRCWVHPRFNVKYPPIFCASTVVL